MSNGHPEPSVPSTDDRLGGAGPVPVLAVVGRPNVGKSTLVNRIIGRREAVVEDVPGVTRDRVSYDANWNGRAFTVVDTGGWDPDARGLAERIAAQAEIAVGLADAVLFVVDATVGITDTDEAVVKILRASKKPVVLAANKVDDHARRGRGVRAVEPRAGGAVPGLRLHGRGSGDLLDAVLAALPEPPPELEAEVGGPRRIAIVGKPNVGKSSLLNQLAEEDRVVVDNVAGTTVDPVDELVELGGRTWRFIDTAGIRKRVKEASGHEYYASLRTSTAIDRAEVAVLVIDGGESISEQDLRIIQTDPRGRPGAGHRVQQVGPRRRGAPLLPRARDRARPGAGAVGAADQRHRPHRLAHRPAGARAGQGARGLGDPDHDRRAQRVPGPAGRRAPAPGPQRQAAEDPVRHPGLRPRRRRSSCSPAASWTRATSASSSVACARSSASSARRSCCSSARGRGASGSFRGCAPSSCGGAGSGTLGSAVPSGAARPDRSGGATCARRSRRTTSGAPTSPAAGPPRSDDVALPHVDRARPAPRLRADRTGGGADYGIPITVVPATTASAVRFTYADESDHVRYPFGADTQIEGGRNSDGDGHAIVVDQSHLPALRDLEHPIATAAGAPAPGRPGRCVATTFARTAGPPPTRPGCRSCPGCCAGTRSATGASITRSGSPPTSPAAPTCGQPATTPGRRTARPTRRWGQVPAEGGFSTDGYGPAARAVIRAMKRYGLVLADNGSPWFFQGSGTHTGRIG